MASLDDLSKPKFKDKAEPIIEKWSGFVGKVRDRVTAVLNEAEAGLDALILQHATDHGPMGAAFTAVQTRFAGLGQKLGDAWDKINEEWDEATDFDGLKPPDYEILNAAWEEMFVTYRSLRDEIDRTYALLETQKNADWARRLRELAQADLAKPITCSQCGAPFQIEVQWESTNVTCEHCGAANEVSGGNAAMLFYQGLGVHALAHEAAMGDWLAEQAAKDAFDNFSHATDKDFDDYLGAARRYHTKYYETVKEIHPGFKGGVQEMAEAKLGHYTAWTGEGEKQLRAYFGQLVSAAEADDQDKVLEIAKNPHQSTDLDEVVHCLVEHKQRKAARTVLKHKYVVDGEDEPRKRWIAEQLKEVDETIRSRTL